MFTLHFRPWNLRSGKYCSDIVVGSDNVVGTFDAICVRVCRVKHPLTFTVVPSFQKLGFFYFKKNGTRFVVCSRLNMSCRAILGFVLALLCALLIIAIVQNTFFQERSVLVYLDKKCESKLNRFKTNACARSSCNQVSLYKFPISRLSSPILAMFHSKSLCH
jgi:hypothetical protein